MEGLDLFWMEAMMPLCKIFGVNERRAKMMLSWDVNNGVTRRSW